MTTTADSIVGDFWKAIIGCNREMTRRIGAELYLLVPLVRTPAYDFPNSPQGAGAAGEGASTAAAGGLVSQAAESDTSKTTVDGRNLDGKVSWLVVSDELTCGARLGAKGNLDFIACGQSTVG